MTTEAFEVIEKLLNEQAAERHRVYYGGPGDGVMVLTPAADEAKVALNALHELMQDVERYKAALREFGGIHTRGCRSLWPADREKGLCDCAQQVVRELQHETRADATS